MRAYIKQLIPLVKRIGWLLLIYSICRALFYYFNHIYFSDLSLKELLSIFFFGIRFDLSAIFMTNAVYIILFLLPTKFHLNKHYQIFLKALFLFINSISILSNCIDLVYFKFITKRSTADLFDLISTGNDFTQLLPVFIKDYWYVLIIWLSLSYLITWGYSKPKKTDSLLDPEYKFENMKTRLGGTITFFLFFLSVSVSVLLFRGGFQLKPISVITAGEYSQAKNIPLLINTPFSILKTIEAGSISESQYFSEQELKNIYNPIRRFKNRKIEKKNVIVIIMESFSKEYIGALNGGKGYTPFLDSLISESLVFDNAYANGKKSMEGVPAVLAGIPALMTEPYITSNYGSNNITSLANILKKEGYTSSFFHGGTNGTMGFDAFANLSGYNYYGRSEYNNEKDFDGHWGIWDEPFFQYFAEQTNQMEQPFLNTIFSLSSHHPYNIPKEYNNIYKNESPLHQSILYADQSLRKFFSCVSKESWFNKTLFIITADHTGDTESPEAANRVGMYQIPIIFFQPNAVSKGMNHHVMQQIDIMPSILDLLGYSKPFFSFGKSVFDTTEKGYAVNYINESYQIISDTFALQFDGSKSTALYRYQEDKSLRNNIIEFDSSNSIILEKELKARIQVFNHALVKNQMVVE